MNYFANLRRLVVKVGTSTLTHDTGKLNLRRMDHLVRVLSTCATGALRSFSCPPAPSAWAWAS